MKHDRGEFYAAHYGMGKAYYRDGSGIRIAPETIPQIIDDIERDARRRWQKARDLGARGNEAMGAFDLSMGYTWPGIRRLLRGQVAANLALRRHFRRLCPSCQLNLF